MLLETEEDHRYFGLKNMALMFIMCEDSRHQGAKRKRTTAQDVVIYWKRLFQVFPGLAEVNLETASEVVIAFRELRYIPEGDAEKEAFCQDNPEPHCVHIADYVLSQLVRRKLGKTPLAPSKKPPRTL